MSDSEDNPLYCSFVGVQYLVCECGEAFQNEETLRIHLEQKHPLKQKLSVRRLKKAPPPITEYKCGECGQIYDTEEECMNHQEVDHIPYMEEMEYELEDSMIPDIVIPSTSARSQGTLEQMVVTAEPTLRVQSLPSTRHVASSEKKKRTPRKKRAYKHQNVQCETCGKKYASNAAMRYHQRVHTGVRPYKCMFCPKSFTMSLFLQVHIRTHTGEKPYHCESCPKVFSNRAALLRHDRVHTGVKPYQCPSCGKCFTQSNSLKLHFHTVHLKLPAPYKSKRRRAESQARADQKDRGEEAEIQLLTEEESAPRKVYYEIKTPAGRLISLSTIVPKRVKQEALVSVKQEQTQETSEQVEIKEEVFYYSVKPEAIEDDVAYEIVYE